MDFAVFVMHFVTEIELSKKGENIVIFVQKSKVFNGPLHFLAHAPSVVIGVP